MLLGTLWLLRIYTYVNFFIIFRPSTLYVRTNCTCKFSSARVLAQMRLKSFKCGNFGSKSCKHSHLKNLRRHSSSPYSLLPIYRSQINLLKRQRHKIFTSILFHAFPVTLNFFENSFRLSFHHWVSLWHLSDKNMYYFR